MSRSKAVLASTADSAVDLASQWVISRAEAAAGRWDPAYPVGRNRLEGEKQKTTGEAVSAAGLQRTSACGCTTSALCAACTASHKTPPSAHPLPRGAPSHTC